MDKLCNYLKVLFLSISPCYKADVTLSKRFVSYQRRMRLRALKRPSRYVFNVHAQSAVVCYTSSSALSQH